MFVVMKNMYALILAVMCVGHLNSKYFLIDTEDDDMGPREGDLIRDPPNWNDPPSMFGSGDKGEDFADPPSSTTTTSELPEDYDPSFWLRFQKR